MLARDVAHGAADCPACDILLCPPFVHLPAVLDEIADSPVRVGAQNVCDQPEGAYTGEVSAAMLADLGCSHAILGHSERRHVYGESEALIERKFVLLHELAQQNPAMPRPILCVGETLEQREAGQTMEVLRRQLQPAQQCPTAFPRAVIAYEPVWAIGTGRAATPDMAQEAHAEIRACLQSALGETAEAVAILYGGSVKPANAAELLAMPDIDGGLIGGASLHAEDFLAIAQSMRQ